MPNAAAHRLGAALAVSGISAFKERQNGESTAAPLAHGSLAALLGTLPDILEPATSPNHRQFFHSLAFAGIVGYGLYRLHKWEAENEWHQVLKTVAMIAGGAYLVHLVMDAGTAKSLPLI
jgi:inner membrane protein